LVWKKRLSNGGRKKMNNKINNLDLSLILALYNEGQTLPNSLARIFNVLDNSKFSYEVILIDDKSQDETAGLVNKIIAGRNNCHFYQHEKNVGRGGTVTEGIRLAKGRVVGFLDVDLEASPIYIPEMVEKILKNEANVVTGLRVYKLQPSLLFRHISSLVYRWLVKLLIKLPFYDTETGYKFFNREKILPVIEEVQDKGWFWDTEIMAQVYSHRLKVLESPVLFIRRFDKKSTVKIFQDSWDYLVKLIKYSKSFRKR
jgi:glycosyltransferase involved in cell wall biosynthesis